MPAALALKKKSRQVDDGGESSTRRVSKRSRRNQEDDEGDDELVVDGERNAGRDEDDRGEGSSQSALARLDKSVLVSSLEERRRAVLQRLSGHVTSTDDLVCLDEQARALEQTLKATVQRGESNSVLLVGPRGSGKDAVSRGVLPMIWLDGRSLTLRRSGCLAPADPQDFFGFSRLADAVSPRPDLSSTMHYRPRSNEGAGSSAHSARRPVHGARREAWPRRGR